MLSAEAGECEMILTPLDTKQAVAIFYPEK